MSRVVVGPFNRVEGDLEVTLDVENGVVREARVSASLYRGFEQLLLGRPAADALAIAPRICGICSVSQSLAAAAVLRAAQPIAPAPNGLLATNIAHAAENIADHLTHFYVFFMPDFARAAYAGRPWHAAAEARFKAVSGAALREALPARARLLETMGLIAGKWPHSLAFQHRRHDPRDRAWRAHPADRDRRGVSRFSRARGVRRHAGECTGHFQPERTRSLARRP
jgi:hydrogenase large subunit